jgi:hypothetical protein
MVNLKYGEFERLFSKIILSTSQCPTLVLPPIATHPIINNNKIKIKIVREPLPNYSDHDRCNKINK